MLATMKLRLGFLLGFVLIVSSAVSAMAADPSGSWRFTLESPKGSADSTLTLQLKDATLSGSIDNRMGKAKITNATFSNDQIVFTVARKISRRTLNMNYSGKLEGNTIVGAIQTVGRDGHSISVPWKAQRIGS